MWYFCLVLLLCFWMAALIHLCRIRDELWGLQEVRTIIEVWSNYLLPEPKQNWFISVHLSTTQVC
jgi:hypothetical protein